MSLFRSAVNQRVAMAASLALGCQSHAQCTPDWVPGAPYPGIYGGASDSVVWDPDGPGPEPEMLVITGEFDMVGGVPAHNVAAWDGTQWQALGAGFGGRSSDGDYGPWWSYCLGVANGELYAGVSGGSCSPFRPGCSYGADILRWNGSDWVEVAGFGGRGGGSISALGAFGGELIVAGSFANSDGVPARRIARWNGQEWLPLGASPDDGIDGHAYTLLVHGGRLIVAGMFSSAGGVAARNIASWDGQVWRPLGVGLGGEYGVSVLAVYGNELIAGGSFDASTGDPEHIARWDGAQWQPLGAGIGGVDGSYVGFLEVYSGELIAGGSFDEAGGMPARGAASWNGSQWRPWDAGMEYVRTFGVCQGSLLAGGSLSTASGSFNVSIARWNGDAWDFFGDGLTGPVTGLALHNSELIGAMAMDHYGALGSCNAPLPAAVARWDGQCWSPLETRDPNDPGLVTVLTTYGSDLVVGGRFATMDGVPAGNIARWDGAAWHALGTGLGVPNGSVDPIVKALTVYEGQLVAGGSFRTTGALPVERVARWDGAQWQPMGAGFPNSFPGSPFVAALVVHNGVLFAGGRFDFAGLQAGVARWNPAASVWEPILPLDTINDFITALVVYGNDLIAAGMVSEYPDFLPFMARWDGSMWHPMGGGLASDPEPVPRYGIVDALAVEGTTLVAGGRFGLADGVPVNNIAHWDGAQWHALGGGVTFGFADPDPYGGPSVSALAFHAGTLAVGGDFLRAGDHASAYFALWRCPPCPADFNADSTVDSEDFFDFLGAFFDGAAAADFNGDNVINSQDFFDFLAAFFAGC